MDLKIAELYDEYLHSPMGRRNFLQKLTILAGGAAAASAALALLEGQSAHAAEIAEDDHRLTTAMITYEGASGPVRAYQVRPAGAEELPGMIIVHANRGLWPHYKDIARKTALAGYAVIAPDLLSSVGGTPQSGESRGAEGDAALERLARVSHVHVQSDLAAAVDFLRAREDTTRKVGALGFCWGGGHVLDMAVNVPVLDAAVAYYGSPPKEGYANIKAHILAHYAADDPRLIAQLPTFIGKMEEHDKPYELYIYANTRHAFNQDNRPDRYDAAAAELAWERTGRFLREHLN